MRGHPAVTHRRNDAERAGNFLRLPIEEPVMLGATKSGRDMPRDPHTLPEVCVRWEDIRIAQARLRRVEDAWAMHALRANGFAAGEAASPGAGT